jgi:signal transduction histidine kinase
MPTLLAVLASTALINAALGLFVYLTRPGRPQNRQFFMFTLNLSVWAGCVGLIVSGNNIALAGWLIRAASYVSVLIPITFYMLCLSIEGKGESTGMLLRHTRLLLILSQVAGLLCFTPYFLTSVTIASPTPGAVPIPIAEYGPAFPLYNLYFPLALGWIITHFARHLRRTSGICRNELHFVLLGMGTFLLIGLTTNVLLPALTGNSSTQPYGPLGILAMNAVVAYGMVTRKIMEVAVLLRRITAYALLTSYLLLLYMGLNFSLHWTMDGLGFACGEWPQMLSALAVAFSLAPAHGRMQRLANLLFINIKTIDVGNMVQRVGNTLQSISTVDELLTQFTEIVSNTLGTDRVAVLLSDEVDFVEVHPCLPESTPVHIISGSPLAKGLRLRSSPLVLDTLKRRRLSPLMAESVESLERLQAEAAVGIYFKGRLNGIMLLGPRLSGRFYGAAEEEALQIVCNEFAVSLENAKLFTETSNSRIYNDILLDSLGSGVVAADRDHNITTFNRDAARLLRMPSSRLVGRSVDALPDALARTLKETLATGQRCQSEDISIVLETGDRVHLRIAASVFNSHTGETSGALIVFHDVTNLKGLQDQIRRSDRLASMGTLSAGMAHEIKNPLVTIKTFTQLLPERYSDHDFRENFVSLVSQEVKRIDSLVNQLLTFSRPSKPELAPMRMHSVLDESLNLVQQQFTNRKVSIERDYRCKDDGVMGDADLLSQAFVNFFLNAEDAMETGGVLHVTTSIVQNRHSVLRRNGNGNGNGVGNGNGHHRGATMVIRIQDTGCGIGDDDLDRIFDPFFTTKSDGTGLGLAVAHGIIEEQGGAISVESRRGDGTAFVIDFPMSSPEKRG